MKEKLPGWEIRHVNELGFQGRTDAPSEANGPCGGEGRTLGAAGIAGERKEANMNRLKQLFFKHFEFVVVLVIVVSILVVQLLIERKWTFLSFYYLPVLCSGYFLGKRHAIGTAVFSILTVAFIVALDPGGFEQGGGGRLFLVVDLVSWSGFLLLTGIMTGLLFDAKQRQLEELRSAYIGIVEILAKYLESTDRYTKGHSLRVANIATDIAVAMELPRSQVENVRTAALLHDIGKVEISGELIRKAAELTTEEKKTVSSHSGRGAELLATVGAVLKDSIPLVLHHHRYYEEGVGAGGVDSSSLPLGSRIIAVADAYDAIVTDRPYRKGRPPWQAFQEIKESTPAQFDPEVVDAFRQVMSKIHEEREG